MNKRKCNLPSAIAVGIVLMAAFLIASVVLWYFFAPPAIG
jgi:hypothetical protein